MVLTLSAVVALKVRVGVDLGPGTRSDRYGNHDGTLILSSYRCVRFTVRRLSIKPNLSS